MLPVRYQARTTIAPSQPIFPTTGAFAFQKLFPRSPSFFLLFFPHIVSATHQPHTFSPALRSPLIVGLSVSLPHIALGATQAPLFAPRVRKAKMLVPPAADDPANRVPVQESAEAARARTLLTSRTSGHTPWG